MSERSKRGARDKEVLPKVIGDLSELEHLLEDVVQASRELKQRNSEKMMGIISAPVDKIDGATAKMAVIIGGLQRIMGGTTRRNRSNPPINGENS